MIESQIISLRKQNDYLVQQLGGSNQSYQKLNDKYQKALKQLALVIKANESLKKDYDQLQNNKQKAIQQACQINKHHLQEYIKKQVDQQNLMIEKYKSINDKLQNQTNQINLKFKTLELSYTLIQKQKKQIQQKYENLKTQYDNLYPQITSHNNNHDKLSQQLRNKTRIIDQLQSAYQQLQKQKNSVQNQYNKIQQEFQLITQKWNQIKIQSSKEQKRGLVEQCQQNHKIIVELSQKIQLLQHQKNQLQQRLQSYQQHFLQQQPPNSLLQTQSDLLSMLKDLHQQLSPLRKQISCLKRDKSQKTILSSRDKAMNDVHLIKLQKELDQYKQNYQKLINDIKQNRQNQLIINQLNWKNAQLVKQQQLLQGKIIVLESHKIADRTRVGSDTYNVLKQFQKRIQLIIQDSHLPKDLQGNHLQQLIAMKAYILQLDERITLIGLQSQHILKKNQLLKQKVAQQTLLSSKIQSMQSNSQLIYKQKILSYDKLVQKLTSQLQKSLHHHKLNPQQDFNRIATLYQQKMINIGEELIKVRNQKLQTDNQINKVTFQFNRNLRLLNDKERDIVALKTDNIHLNNKIISLERQINNFTNNNHLPSNHHVPNYNHLTNYNQNQSNQQNSINQSNKSNQPIHKYFQTKQLQGQINNQSKLTYIIQEQNRQIRARHEQEYLKIKKLYENQIEQLRKYIIERQKQVTQKTLEIQKLMSINKQSSIKHYTNQKIQKDITSQRNINIFKSQLQNQYQALMIQQKQNSLKLDNQVIQLKAQKTQFLLKIKNLQQQIRKKNHKIQNISQELHISRVQSKNKDLQNIQKQHLRTKSYQEFIQQNRKLNNLNYQLSMKISGFQSIMFNIKLQCQRYKKQSQTLQQKIIKMQQQIYQSKSKINSLQSKIRNQQNQYENTLMAKDSLIRSYEAQIQNLKYMIEDVRQRNAIQQKDSRIKQLQNQNQQKLEYQNQNQQNNISQSYVYHDNASENNQIMQNLMNYNNQLKHQLSNKNNQISNLSLQINKLNDRFSQQINKLQAQYISQISQLQAQLKYRNQETIQLQAQLKYRNQEIIELQAQLKNRIQQIKSRISELNTRNQEINIKNQEIKIKNQEINIKNQEIKIKRQEIEQRRLIIQKLQKQNLPSLTRLSQKQLIKRSSQLQQGLSNSSAYHQQIQNLNTQLLSLRTTIITLRDQIQLKQQKNSQLKHQIYALKLQNKKLQGLQNQNIKIKSELQSYYSRIVYSRGVQNDQSDQSSRIDQLNNQIIHLKQTIQVHQNKQKHQNQQMVQELQRLRRQKINNDSQKCRLMASQIQRLQSGIQQVKYTFQNEINSMNIYVRQLQQQLKVKNYEIQNLKQNLLIKTKPIQNRSQNSQNIDYLIRQIQRLNQILLSKDEQLQNTTILNQQYQDQRQRYQENLSIMILLFVQIQALRNQLDQRKTFQSEQFQQLLKQMKITNLKIIQGSADFDIIKEIEFSHQQLLNYHRNVQKFAQSAQNELMNKNISTNKIQAEINYIRRQTPYPNSSIIIPPLNLLPSSTINMTSTSNIPSTIFITSNSSIPSPTKIPFINPPKLELGSYGKISQSHNMEESYPSSLDSSLKAKDKSQNVYLEGQQQKGYTLASQQAYVLQPQPAFKIKQQQVYIPQTQQIYMSQPQQIYKTPQPQAYTLKDVNMISSVSQDQNNSTYYVQNNHKNNKKQVHKYYEPSHSQSSIDSDLQSTYYWKTSPSNQSYL